MSSTGERVDPFMAFRFVVRLDGMSVGGFSEVSGIQAEVEVTEVKEGGVNGFVHRLPGRARHSNLTLRRGLVGPSFWVWFNEVVIGNVQRMTVSVELMEPDGGAPAARWVFEKAFPCKWNGPDLRAEQSAVAVEAVELCHHGFVMEGS